MRQESQNIHPNASNGGYTLIEALIALAIFSIGILAMGGLQTSSLMAMGEVTRGTEALAILGDQMEALKTLPFYQTVNGIDYDNDGVDDGATAFPADLVAGAHNQMTQDNRFSVNWVVVDNTPIPQQSNFDFQYYSLPAGNYTVSKTITVWVNEAGSNAQADALVEAQIVKAWVADGV